MTRSHKMVDSHARKSVDMTVAICTWNRARPLDQSLSAMREQRIPTDVERELLIVNNNCTDETDRVHGLRLLDVSRQGGFCDRANKLSTGLVPSGVCCSGGRPLLHCATERSQRCLVHGQR